MVFFFVRNYLKDISLHYSYIFCTTVSMLSPSQTLFTHTHTHPLLKVWINIHSLPADHHSIVSPIKITVYISKKSRKHEAFTEPLQSTMTRQHQLVKYLQPPHFWPGVCINPVLGGFGGNTSPQIHSNSRCLWVGIHTCVLWPNTCSNARFPAPKVCTTTSQVPLGLVLAPTLAMESSISGRQLKKAGNEADYIFAH